MQQTKHTKTIFVKKSEVKRHWWILDAKGKTLGRFASEVAKILRGKHKTTFTPNVDNGDGVVVINAEKIRVTGAKKAQKMYQYYTGSIKGLRQIPYENMLARKPEFIIEHAVRGMMPKTRLAKAQMKKLRVCKGEEHGQISQQPQVAEI